MHRDGVIVLLRHRKGASAFSLAARAHKAFHTNAFTAPDGRSDVIVVDHCNIN
jgi:hypothetical protein